MNELTYAPRQDSQIATESGFTTSITSTCQHNPTDLAKDKNKYAAAHNVEASKSWNDSNENERSAIEVNDKKKVEREQRKEVLYGKRSAFEKRKQSSGRLLSANSVGYTLKEQAELLYFEYDLAPSTSEQTIGPKADESVNVNPRRASNAANRYEERKKKDDEANSKTDANATSTATGSTHPIVAAAQGESEDKKAQAETITNDANSSENEEPIALNLPSEEELLKMINPTGKFLAPAIKRKLLDDMIDQLIPPDIKQKIEEQKAKSRKKMARPPEYDLLRINLIHYVLS
ncbi:hypothetical protein RFI_18484 [Reticulomyxa filosa]|uniref:Uncharacterized protein n=1 Tax=Reticulomyxa filosa TaxID=46433 RepID=X6MY58_RETFI|nr:hypothetical protein RFI_18484 [Reticulomyxa filosa]|eukprot:ETO18771.1 hypothetical protein RFI_18484 [Reticulomyxa filosa]